MLKLYSTSVVVETTFTDTNKRLQNDREKKLAFSLRAIDKGWIS